jgi:imidazolonepropionase-like amidohydrolase
VRQALVDTRFLRARRADADRGQTRPLAGHPLDLAALGPVVDRKVPLTISADRAADIVALLQLAREQKIRLVIVGGAEAWKVRDQLAEARVPVVLQPTRNLPGSFSELGARNENAALLHEAGVELAIAVLGEPHNVRNVRQEAGIAVSYGLPYQAALAAITRNIAHIYGMDAKYGTIAPGRKANLVVWSGDPLELSSWPEQVMIHGKSIPSKSRQTQLRDRYMDLTKYRP